MKSITISEAQKNTSPNPITLICTEAPDGTTNLAAISWWTYLSNRPPMIGFVLSQKGYTGELMKKNKRAVLSIPGEVIADEAFQCGCVSGRKANKADKFKIPLTGTKDRFPVHSKLAFVCVLESAADVGDHTFYVCKVEDILFNENEKQLFSWDGYAKLAPL